jgi:hypothetical protein
MNNRVWAYLGFSIVISALLVWYFSESRAQTREIQTINNLAEQEQTTSFDAYLAKQTDERKLLVLAKLLRSGEQWRLRKIADRAYALNPTARDVALFASYFRHRKVDHYPALPSERHAPKNNSQ